MNSLIYNRTEDEIQELSPVNKFSKLFTELEFCVEIDQKVKIEEINGLMEEIGKEEFRYFFTTELFNRIDKMIGKKENINGNCTCLAEACRPSCCCIEQRGKRGNTKGSGNGISCFELHFWILQNARRTFQGKNQRNYPLPSGTSQSYTNYPSIGLAVFD
ncbi:uncharacterized protein MONOS_12383 [Monocercomonoides exilis]|uniref:uncharacterized protein n=1 Tax=Monocercomonoides exilis TaxID=2049356 RepID=UPI00355A9900|nr:hypothetical protein MONOS_12383 [Monocercomonoides exilis]|eukprot:MONOS_12383.1-p1 / transcript=MONOS_12383.1 / gene=MONOS_12383 / organism=Monocercomonoides_exilis_PA203 / gene_product=unspecified product / transcript_product=unspecified product / location=Mono_scaffold00681:30120-30922(+) / protein_length=160 / sequence_SO=supercontig / SO=protein_coding / is_pseudo=false